MNRRERRAALARAKVVPTDVDDLIAQATRTYRQGRSAEAELICKQALGLTPDHTSGLNLLAVIYQASGRHKQALKLLTNALAADNLDAACHYNLGISYQALEQRDSAASHFKWAIALGLSGRDVEQLLMTNATVVECARRVNEHGSAGRI